MSQPSFDAAIDELYGGDPSEFVANRKRLAAELRSRGDKSGAKELQAARRPSTSAWALNQLARHHAPLVEALLERSADLVAAQTRALSGRPDAMRAAIRAHRDALDAAAAAALELLGARANDAFRDEIVSTLRAASTDDDLARELRTGRVVREAAAQGFPDATGLTLVPAPPANAKPAKAVTSAKQTEAAAKAERAAKREQEQAALAAARRELSAADGALKDIEARIGTLQDELDGARRERREAQQRQRNANREVERLRGRSN
jgi:hypothetical protein